MALPDIHISRERPRANVTETHTYVHNTYIQYTPFKNINKYEVHFCIYMYVSVTNNCISSTT